MEPTALESAESWATIVAASITALALTVGGSVAFWKFVLQQPFGNTYDIRVTPCLARAMQDGTGNWTVAYTATLRIENQSAAAHKIRGWWRRMRFNDEVEPDYDPDANFVINSDSEAQSRYGEDNRIEEGYALASGETYSDQLFRARQGTRQEICYIEYTVKYERWFWKGDEYKSQILIVPIERADLER